MKQAKKHLRGVLFLFPQRGLGGGKPKFLYGMVFGCLGSQERIPARLVGWLWPRLKQALRACFSELLSVGRPIPPGDTKGQDLLPRSPQGGRRPVVRARTRVSNDSKYLILKDFLIR